MHCGFVDSRLRRFPPLRCAQSCGRPVENALRFPPPAHRPAAAHKLHSAPANLYKIRESQNPHPTTGLSLFDPGGCPDDRNHRSLSRLLSLIAVMEPPMIGVMEPVCRVKNGLTRGLKGGGFYLFLRC